MTEWLGKNVRVQVRGDNPYAGQKGKAIRRDGRNTWMVKLDGRMFGTSIPTGDLQPEGKTD